MTQRFIVILPALQAVEWIVSTDAQQSLDIAKQLHHFLPSNSNESALNIETVRSIHCRTCELPAAVRAFCVHALPGNPVLWPHQTLMSSPKAGLVTAIVDVVADLVFDAAFQSEAALMMNTVPVDVAESGHAHLCVQQLWVSGVGVSISSLLKKRNYTITASVVRLLQWIAIRAPHEVSTRRVLLGTPNISVVADILAGIAESAAFKGGGLRKKAVQTVVEHAFCLLRALVHTELTSVFSDSLVMSTSTFISESKDYPTLLQHGLCALVHLAAALPLAASMALEFNFLAEQCTIADSLSANVGRLIVGSLDVMSAIVVQQSVVVTFEWIEILHGVLQNLGRWRDTVPSLDAAAWRCVRPTVESSGDCAEFLFTEEALEVLRNELGRIRMRRRAPPRHYAVAPRGCRLYEAV